MTQGTGHPGGTVLERLRRISPRTRLFLAIVFVVLIVDQITKYYAVKHLTRSFEPPAGQSEPIGFGEAMSRYLWNRHPARAEPVEVMENFWHFRYAENPGAAFSFFARMPQWFRIPFFMTVSLAAMVFIAIYFRRTTDEQKWLRMALALVFGGALGNFLDRAHLGYVIDFIDWHWYTGPTWPTFNVADAAISVGITVMVLEMWFQRAPEEADAKRAGKSKPKPKPKDDDEPSDPSRNESTQAT